MFVEGEKRVAVFEILSVIIAEGGCIVEENRVRSKSGTRVRRRHAREPRESKDKRFCAFSGY